MPDNVGMATVQEIDDAVATHGHLISADPIADPDLPEITGGDDSDPFPPDWTGGPGTPEGILTVESAADLGWGAGWPSCSGASGDLATVTTKQSRTRVTVRRGIAQLVSLLMDECERRGYAFHPDQCGGYNCRAISGTRQPSNHSWGLAIDLNWQFNPQRKPLTTNIPGWMVGLFERYGFEW